MSIAKLQGAFSHARTKKFTAGSTLAAGAVVVIGDRATVVLDDVASGAVGVAIVETDALGIKMPKTTGAKTADTKAYWDADGNPVSGEAGSGAVTEVEGTEAVQVDLLDGQDEASDATYTLAAMAAGDEVIFVGHISTKAAIATLADVTASFSAGAGVLTADTPADRTNDQLLVIWRDASAKNTFLGYFAASALSGDAEVAVELVNAR